MGLGMTRGITHGNLEGAKPQRRAFARRRCAGDARSSRSEDRNATEVRLQAGQPSCVLGFAVGDKNRVQGTNARWPSTA